MTLAITAFICFILGYATGTLTLAWFLLRYDRQHRRQATNNADLEAMAQFHSMDAWWVPTDTMEIRQ